VQTFSDVETKINGSHRCGNDGAHGGSLDEAGAADMLDFTRALLERITMPIMGAVIRWCFVDPNLAAANLAAGSTESAR
jgi:hypothetical protein